MVCKDVHEILHKKETVNGESFMFYILVKSVLFWAWMVWPARVQAANTGEGWLSLGGGNGL